jgi:hypothetical protein
VTRTFALRETNEALVEQASHQSRGKLVIVIDE